MAAQIKGDKSVTLGTKSDETDFVDEPSKTAAIQPKEGGQTPEPQDQEVARLIRDTPRRLSSDAILDLYQRAKELRSNRLMNFVRSLKTESRQGLTQILAGRLLTEVLDPVPGETTPGETTPGETMSTPITPAGYRPRPTFKQLIATGRFRSFANEEHEIKLGGRPIGSIVRLSGNSLQKIPPELVGKYKIRLMVVDPSQPGGWGWIRLKYHGDSAQETKEWLVKNWSVISSKFQIHQLDS
jgi:hypothetical protein